MSVFNNNVNELIPRILKAGGTSLFYAFANADGKSWIIPDKNTITAMNLYQPSSRKGKLMKRFFPFLKRIGFIRSKLGVEIKQYALCNELNKVLSSLFQTENPEFSLFCGTPSVHQKITIQLNEGQKILGYCKVTDNEEVKKIFWHEKKVLDEWKEKGIKEIPECIYCGALKENIAIFVQTTVKTNSSIITHRWDKQHWKFLAKLQSQTGQKLPFEQTNYFQMLNRLSSQLRYLPNDKALIVKSAIEIAQIHYLNKEVTFSGYHGDFTPWNMFVEQNNLFVFDFEYAQMTYPPYLDYFHFFTQQAIYTKHLDSTDILEAYNVQKNGLGDYFSNPNLSYLLYLLDVIERYINREKGEMQDDTEKNINIWISLISNFTSSQL